MMSDARQNGGKEHYVKHCKFALPVIFKRYSLLIGPNAVKRYGVTVIPAFLSGIGRHFKRSVDTLIDECLVYTVQLTMRGRAVLDTGVWCIQYNSPCEGEPCSTLESSLSDRSHSRYDLGALSWPTVVTPATVSVFLSASVSSSSSSSSPLHFCTGASDTFGA